MMADRKKVIKGLEHCIVGVEEGPFCDGCPYSEDDSINCLNRLKSNALELLKEQEPVKPIDHKIPVGIYGAETSEYLCGSCGCGLTYTDRWHTKYCPECGKAVRWG